MSEPNDTSPIGPKGTATNPTLANLPASTNARSTFAGEDTSARASEDGRLVEVGRNHPSFHYPVVKHPTGRVQFRLDRAEVVTIERLGDVHRGQVVSVGPLGKPPTPKALDFARGLVVTGNFSHVAADTPLGVPAEVPKSPMTDSELRALDDERRATENAELVDDLEALRAAGAFGASVGTVAITDKAADFNVSHDFNSDPPMSTFSNIDTSAKSTK